MTEDFWEALARACDGSLRYREPVALLLLRSQSREGTLAAVHEQMAAGDMAISLPGRVIAVLLPNASDERATAFIHAVRARTGAFVTAGYAWALGDSGPAGLYEVARQALREDTARITPLAQAS